MTRLISNCCQADGRGKERREGADHRHEGHHVGGVFKDRRQAADHEDACRDHGRGVDERRDRCWAFHRVRQPGVQTELGRFTHGTDKQKEAEDFKCWQVQP